MAFVRWRGRSSQLVATVYEDGRSKKVTLANLPGFYVSETIKREVAEKFPHIKVDWAAVDRALAQGPPGILKSSTPPEHLTWADIEHHLRCWAACAESANRIGDATRLRIAAEVLTKWRTGFYFENQVQD
jgi:hypothetical protein